MEVIRQWKRDGTQNYMDFEVAVQNIKTNRDVWAGHTPQKRASIGVIRQQLRDGIAIETPHAIFYAADCYPITVLRLTGDVVEIGEVIELEEAA